LTVGRGLYNRMVDFDREITLLNYAFYELIGSDTPWRNHFRIGCYCVDLYYYISRDKVFARFFRGSHPHKDRRFESDKNVDIEMSLPEFILYFANPEGAFILEQMTFKNT
jgi:hypothetical protein